ncbi:ribosome maturation factor RimP [Pueribacillus theae]|uniref:Ribosome maturation factor RimP n=1 Tax=Pueribacillus theae TaxID=2171751 RepID=A0A2U1K7N6_9BACI|nr:ribosome maturation factor RimP [Pueribacillus theae]PWA13540.1 ribosome maturation factor RimP [Pueribacillus theae]
MAQSITELTEQIVTPILNEMNLELVDVEYVKEGKNWFLRVYIDSKDGVDIEECGKVSEQLSQRLDEYDPVPQAYFLEVSSPGVERPLKKIEHFQNAVGKQVHIKTYEPIDGNKTFEGKLLQFDGEVATVEYKEKHRVKKAAIPYEKIASARLAVLFN